VRNKLWYDVRQYLPWHFVFDGQSVSVVIVVTVIVGFGCVGFAGFEDELLVVVWFEPRGYKTLSVKASGARSRSNSERISGDNFENLMWVEMISSFAFYSNH
jgi:hypothetical protein